MIGLVALILLSSCNTTQMVNQKYPIIPMPKRPNLSIALDKKDLEAMVKYAKKLEVGIEAYNEYATEQNKKIDQHFENRYK